MAFIHGSAYRHTFLCIAYSWAVLLAACRIHMAPEELTGSPHAPSTSTICPTSLTAASCRVSSLPIHSLASASLIHLWGWGGGSLHPGGSGGPRGPSGALAQYNRASAVQHGGKGLGGAACQVGRVLGRDREGGACFRSLEGMHAAKHGVEPRRCSVYVVCDWEPQPLKSWTALTYRHRNYTTKWQEKVDRLSLLSFLQWKNGFTKENKLFIAFL